MSIKNDFVFIMFKPLAMTNSSISSKLMIELCKHGIINYVMTQMRTSMLKVKKHYFNSMGKEWYPPLIHYLAGKNVKHFVLYDKLSREERGEPLADYLRREIIGPSEPHKTKDSHVRNWVIQNNINYRIDVDVPDDEIINGRIHVFDNLIHCSDSIDSAVSEVTNWYSDYPHIVENVLQRMKVTV